MTEATTTLTRAESVTGAKLSAALVVIVVIGVPLAVFAAFLLGNFDNTTKLETAANVTAPVDGGTASAPSIPTPVKPQEMPPGKVFKDCADCPEMVSVPAGSFDMGGNWDSEKPVHRVTIPKAFAIGRTEVTQGQWKSMMGINPSHFSSCGDDCPVEKVSWDDAKSFIQRLSAKTGKNYRLPSEAEWEYACRAGGKHIYCGGGNIASVAWYTSNSGGKTHLVAGKQANAWGLYDMSGNVSEWVEDCWNGNYNGAPHDGSAWTSGECVLRVVRGGSWRLDAEGIRSGFRIFDGSRTWLDNSGFRLARMLP